MIQAIQACWLVIHHTVISLSDAHCATVGALSQTRKSLQTLRSPSTQGPTDPLKPAETQAEFPQEFANLGYFDFHLQAPQFFDLWRFRISSASSLRSVSSSRCLSLLFWPPADGSGAMALSSLSSKHFFRSSKPLFMSSILSLRSSIALFCWVVVAVHYFMPLCYSCKRGLKSEDADPVLERVYFRPQQRTQMPLPILFLDIV